MSKSVKRILFILLAGIIVLNFLSRVYFYKNDIFKNFDPKYWESRYYSSQWVVPNSKNPIGDDGLYIFAGYKYVSGHDPSLINAEIPPLGKYLIGFFEIATGRLGIFSLFFCFLSLLGLYLINRITFRSKIVALIPVLFLSFDTLFVQQIRAPFLDSLLLASLLFSIFLVIKKQYWLAAIGAGIFMASKSPFLGLILIFTYLIYLFLSRNFSFQYVSPLILAGFIYVMSYGKTVYEEGFLHFLKVQKYILNFYFSGAKGITGAVIPMVFFGYWETWWGRTSYINEWTAFWPVTLLLSLYAIYLIFKRRIQGGFLFSAIWFLLYAVFLIFTPVFPRYLLLLLPFMYNLAVWVLFEGTGWTLRFRS